MRHQHISFFKSALRLVGYWLLIPYCAWAAIVLILSEFVGILEELGHE